MRIVAVAKLAVKCGEVAAIVSVISDGEGEAAAGVIIVVIAEKTMMDDEATGLLRRALRTTLHGRRCRWGWNA